MPAVDRGHELTQERRAMLVGWANVNAPEAGYPLGILKLKVLLADSRRDGNPEEIAAQNEERHRAGLDYAADHAIVHGIHSPKSHLAAIIDGRRRGEKAANLEPSKFVLRAHRRYTDKVEALMNAGLVGFAVIQRIAIDEAMDLSEAELPALRRALQALVDLRD